MSEVVGSQKKKNIIMSHASENGQHLSVCDLCLSAHPAYSL